MLASLLPGLRDLRAPLAAGYLWLAALWLAFAPVLPSRADATGVYADILELSDASSVIGLAVVLSFLAYVLGVFAEALLGALTGRYERRLAVQFAQPKYRGFGGARQSRMLWAGRLLARISSPLGERFSQPVLLGQAVGTRSSRSRVHEMVRDSIVELDARLSASGFPSLWDVLDSNPPASDVVDELEGTDADVASIYRELEPLMEAASISSLITGLTDASDQRVRQRDFFARIVVRQLGEEAGLMRTRLLGVEPELFSVIDRLRAEAEFRGAIAPPLAAIGAIATVRGGGWWWLLIGFGTALVLGWQATNRWRASMNRLFDALVLGRVSAPILDRLDAATERLGGTRNSVGAPAGAEGDLIAISRAFRQLAHAAQALADAANGQGVDTTGRSSIPRVRPDADD